MAPDKKEFPPPSFILEKPEVLTGFVLYQTVKTIDIDGYLDPAQPLRDAQELEKQFGGAAWSVPLPGGIHIYIHSLPEALYDAEMMAEGERVENELKALREQYAPNSSAQPE